MAEWVFYTNFTYRRRLRSERRLGELLTAALTNRFQHRLERGLSEYLAAEFSAFCDPPIEELIRLAAPYLHVSFSGEAILSIGKAIEYYHKGVGGIVNTLPFMCMPGTIVSAISRRISQDLNGLPWLNLSYEGLSDKGEELRVEAFMHQVRQFPARS